jgi:lipopolysaccharide/colanic/teichoic acid biosynthesis glycosyltransferase
MRRAFDVLAALLGLVVLLPLFLVVAVIILIDRKGPVFYSARRVGRHGRIFHLYKFRTMIPDADKMGAGITSADDFRVTPVGRVLRHYKLDEFPQLLNVIKGDMSLVGPRPEDPRYIRLYTQAQQSIFNVRPGLTSPASLLYKDEASLLQGPDWEDRYINEVMPAKLQIDLNYFRDNTFSNDICVITRTITKIFSSGVVQHPAAVFLLCLMMSAPADGQSQVLPLEHQLATRLGRILYSSNADIHTSVQPFELSDFNGVSDYDSLFYIARGYGMRADTSASLLSRKVFSEHLYDDREEDYRIVFDILPDASLGNDFDGRHRVWNDTRDFLCEGAIGSKFSFRTEYFESQSRFPSYLDTFISKNFVIPGQGYKRTYGSTAHDYGYATGHISYSPSKYFNFQLGHGKNFIGDGYRSMLLSDAAFDYPYLKITTNFWKIKYVNLWAQFQDIGSTHHYFDRAFTKKFGVFHYLDINLSRRVSIGLYEAIIWRNSDSLGYRGFDVNYLNPIIFFNPVEFSIGSPDNSLMGLNLRWKIFSQSALYAQILIDEFSFWEYVHNNGYWGNKYGLQLGGKTFALFGIEDLSFQTEINVASPYTYSHFDRVSNFGHYNQSLAHPLGANFYESVSIAGYRWNRYELRAQFNWARFGADSNGVNYGSDIFKSYDTRVENYGTFIGQGVSSKVVYADLRIGYVLNPLTNLKIEVGAAFRRQTTESAKDDSMVLMLGLRGSFRNLYYDF